MVPYYDNGAVDPQDPVSTTGCVIMSALEGKCGALPSQHTRRPPRSSWAAAAAAPEAANSHPQPARQQRAMPQASSRLMDNSSGNHSTASPRAPMLAAAIPACWAPGRATGKQEACEQQEYQGLSMGASSSLWPLNFIAVSCVGAHVMGLTPMSLARHCCLSSCCSAATSRSSSAPAPNAISSCSQASMWGGMWAGLKIE